MHGHPVFLYDVFAERRYEGNVAAVVLDADDYDAVDDRIAAAAELHVPVTAFVSGKPPQLILRFATPRAEVPRSTHATIAAATALLEEGRLRDTEILAATDVGPVQVVVGEGTPPTVAIGMRPPRFSAAGERAAVRQLLGMVTLDRERPLEVAELGLRHLIVPMRSLDAIVTSDREVRELCALVGADAIAVVNVDLGDAPVEIRVFRSPVGPLEEPANGSTAGAIASYLHRHGLVRVAGTGRASVEVSQGHGLGRPARIEVELAIDGGEVTEVTVRGRAYRTLHGVVGHFPAPDTAAAPARRVPDA